MSPFRIFIISFILSGPAFGEVRQLSDMPLLPFLRQEGFESFDPVQLWHVSGSFETRYKGLTEESASEGKKSFKLDVVFKEDGECIWRIPWAVPLESSMKMSLQFRTGRHSDAEQMGVGYAVMFTPTDTYYRRISASNRGGGLKGKATDWKMFTENFMTPGWPNDSIVSETRAGPLSLTVAAPVTKYDVGVEMDPLIWIKAKAGQRAVFYVDGLTVEGQAPDPAAYHEAVLQRYNAAAAPFQRQLQQWRARYDRAIHGIEEGLEDVPEHLKVSVNALLGQALYQRARLDIVIDDGHVRWKKLDPIMDTLWGVEGSVKSLRSLEASDGVTDLVHYRLRPTASTPVLPTEIPTVGVIGGRLVAAACRGEYEPVSFAVHASTRIENLTLQVSDLKGPSTIPALAIDPFVVKVWYLSGFYSGDPIGRFLVPDLLLKDDDLVRVNQQEEHNYLRHTAEDGTIEYRLCSGSSSENLKGIRPVQPGTLQPVTVQAGETKAFWLTIHVPEDAESGEYTGSVSLVWDDGRKQKDLPLLFRVLPFDLPPSPLTYSVFNRSRLSPTPEVGNINTEYIDAEWYEREIRNQVEHGVLYPNSYDGLRMLRPVLEARRRAGVGTDKFFCVDLSYHVSLAVKGGEEKREKLKERIANWKPILEEFGYKDFYVMGKDEARGHMLVAQRPVIKLIHEAGAKVWAAATHETTFDHVGDLMDLAVMAGKAKPSEEKKWHGAGKEVFQYGGPMTEWDQAESFRRNTGLVLWKVGFDGMMHYAYRHGFTHIWNDFDNERRDHTFVYPTVGGLIDTLAWEGVREGIDDTRYAFALELAIKNTTDSAGAREASLFLENLMLSRSVDEVREDIVRWIVRLDNPGE